MTKYTGSVGVLNTVRSFPAALHSPGTTFKTVCFSISTEGNKLRTPTNKKITQQLQLMSNCDPCHKSNVSFGDLLRRVWPDQRLEIFYDSLKCIWSTMSTQWFYHKFYLANIFPLFVLLPLKLSTTHLGLMHQYQATGIGNLQETSHCHNSLPCLCLIGSFAFLLLRHYG